MNVSVMKKFMKYSNSSRNFRSHIKKWQMRLAVLDELKMIESPFCSNKILIEHLTLLI